MRKKGGQRKACGRNCDPLDDNNDFTLGVESQKLLLRANEGYRLL